MRKSILITVLLAVALVFSSCNKTKSENGDESVASFVDEKGKAKSVNLIPSVLFYPEGSLWTENADGTLAWAVTLQIGQTLYVYPAGDGSTSEITESQLMKREGKKDEEDYTKVRYDNKDYWVNSSLIVPNAVANITTDKGIVYNDADIASTTSSKVKAGQIIAVHNSDAAGDVDDNSFVKVTFRSDKNYREVYLKNEIISDKKDDLLALRLLPKLDTLKNKVAKAEVIANLKELNVSSFIKEQIADKTQQSDEN
ncbi:MAG: hypothetical protein IKX23_02705 [Treponema sp.]|nr:hypothetical protein [Treponema sp.]